MANIKITDLTAYTDPATTDVVPIVDVGNDTTKKVSVGEVVGKISGDVDVATDGTSSITAGAIVDEDVNAAAAIAGTKIDPDFGSQTVETTGDLAINTDVLFVDSSESAVGIGTAGPNYKLDVSGGFNVSGVGTSAFTVNASAPNNSLIIDSSGRCLVGTSTAVGTSSGTGLIVRSPVNNNHAGEILLQNAYTRPGNASSVGSIKFQDSGGSSYAQITGFQDGTASSSSDVPGGLKFSTTADGASSPTERMRITSDGSVRFGYVDGDIGGNENTNSGVRISSALNIARSAASSKIFLSQVGAVDGEMIRFSRDGSDVGSIDVAGSSTSYNTSSDYRLKENVVPLTGAANRVNQLQVHRFNFIADPDKTVDGFIAHEAQAVVPECVTGIKDEVDDEGNPVYQGIDQSKLVPLLTAALQEALAEIESLKARVTALEP